MYLEGYVFDMRLYYAVFGKGFCYGFIIIFHAFERNFVVQRLSGWLCVFTTHFRSQGVGFPIYVRRLSAAVWLLASCLVRIRSVSVFKVVRIVRDILAARVNVIGASFRLLL